MNYERAGAGRPVLVLHGWGCDCAAVRPITNCLVSLGYECFVPDMPGFGKTPEPKEAWGVPEYAACVRAFIDEMGIEGCDVVCHSFGGRVTIMLASEEPGLFGRLVLVDAAGVRGKRKLKNRLKAAIYKLGKRLAKVKFIDRLFSISERQKNAGSADYRSLRSEVMKKTFVKVVNLDLTDRLGSISNETLLVWGSEDDATPMYMAKIMERKIRNCGLAVLEGAGHFAYADKYPQFCAVMKAFFERKGDEG